MYVFGQKYIFSVVKVQYATILFLKLMIIIRLKGCIEGLVFYI